MDDTCQRYIDQRIKLDHFSYFKGKIIPGVSLGSPVVQGGYLKGNIELLPPIIITRNVQYFTLLCHFFSLTLCHQRIGLR